MSPVAVLNPTYRTYDYQGSKQKQDVIDRRSRVTSGYIMSLLDEQEFERLKNAWLDETKYLSDPERLYCNKNYQEVIRYGFSAIPFIMKDLKENLNDWFCALFLITKTNPIKKEHAGLIEEMANDWIEWYKNDFGITF